VEALLRIDVKTIYSYVQRGLIPYVRIQSNLRFVKADVLRWVVEHSSEVQNPKRKLEEKRGFESVLGDLVSVWCLFLGSTGKHERDLRDYGDFA
jgi:hypothetical protein